MDKDEIKIVQEWFKKDSEDRGYGTYYDGKEYVVRSGDMDAFADFLTENFPDLIGFESIVGKYGILFWDSSLEKAEFY